MSESPAADLAAQYGIETRNERMPNGEIRFRMYGRDGNGYVRVVSGSNGAWQNSHYHHRIRETYIVETGWMVMAQYRRETSDVDLIRFEAGRIVTTEPLRKHNVYLPAHALIHVVKHGSVAGEADWIPAPDLDVLTQCLSEAQVLERSKVNS